VHASLRALILLGIVTWGVPSTAHAEWQFTPFLGLTFQGDTTLLYQEAAGETHWNFGGSVALLGGGPVGVEGLVVYTLGFFQQDNPPNDPPPITITESRALALMGNIVVTTPRRWTEYGLRPFVSGGIGLLHASATDAAEILPVNTNLLGYNVGGGAVGPLSERAGLRFDLRYFSNLRPTNDFETAIGRVRLRYWTATVGFVFRY
jgi:hypothetical protein